MRGNELIISTSFRELEIALMEKLKAEKQEAPFLRQLVVTPTVMLRRYLLQRIPEVTETTFLNLDLMTFNGFIREAAKQSEIREMVGDSDLELWLVSDIIERLTDFAATRSDLPEYWNAWREYSRSDEPVYEAMMDLINAGMDEELTDLFIEEADEFCNSLSKPAINRWKRLLFFMKIWWGERKRLGFYMRHDLERELGSNLLLHDENYNAGYSCHFYGFTTISGLSRELLKKFLQTDDCSCIYLLDELKNRHQDFKVTGRMADETVKPYVVNIRTFSHPKQEPDCTVIDAYNVEGEVREAARILRKKLDGERSAAFLSRTAISARKIEEYLDYIRRIFPEYGIPYSADRSTPASVHPIFRTALRFLECLDNDFPRSIFSDLLISGSIHVPPGLQDNLERLELMTRQMGIISGDDWRILLNRNFLIKGYELNLKISDAGEAVDENGEETAETDPQFYIKRDDRGRISAAEIFEFGEWINSIRDKSMKEWPSEAGWTQHADHFLYILNILLNYTQEETSSTERNSLLDIIERLKTRDRYELPVSRKQFLETLKRLIKKSRITKTVNRGGIRILSAENACGMTFDLLFVLGLSRNKFPQKNLESPILPDDIRKRLRAGPLAYVPVKMEEYEYDRLLFRMLKDSAVEHLYLSYARADDEGKPLSPSLYLQRYVQDRNSPVEKISINRNTKKRLKEEAAEYGDTSILVPSDYFLFAGLTAEPPIEDEAALKLRYKTDNPQALLRNAFYAARKIDEIEELNEFDIFVRKTGSLKELSAELLDSDFYATSLEMLSRCPHQFFLTRALNLVDYDEPELWKLPPVDEGSLVHVILEEFFENLTSSAGFPTAKKPLFDKEQLNALHDICEERFSNHEIYNHIGLAGLWDFDKRRIKEYLTTFVEGDLRRLEETDYKPENFEFPIKRRLVLNNDQKINLAAKVDRKDVRKDFDDVVFIDYKTGKRFPNLTNQFFHGLKLQIPLYLLISQEPHEQGLPDADEPDDIKQERLSEQPSEISAAYFYVQRPEESLDQENFYDLNYDEKGYLLMPHIVRLLRVLAQLIIEGKFVLRTGAHCSYCGVSSACPYREFSAKFRVQNSDDCLVKLFHELVSTAKTKYIKKKNEQDELYRICFNE